MMLFYFQKGKTRSISIYILQFTYAYNAMPEKE